MPFLKLPSSVSSQAFTVFLWSIRTIYCPPVPDSRELAPKMGGCKSHLAGPRTLHEQRQQEVHELYGLNLPAHIFQERDERHDRLPPLNITLHFLHMDTDLKVCVQADDPVVMLKLALHEQDSTLYPPPVAIRIMYGSLEVDNLHSYRQEGVDAEAIITVTWDHGISVTIDGADVVVYPQEVLRCAIARSVQTQVATYNILQDIDAPSRSLNDLMETTVADAGVKAGAIIEKGFQKQLIFTSSFDTNGVLYYLGTNQGTAPYRNPHEIGQVVADMSSSYSGKTQSTLCRVVQNQPSFQTKTVTNVGRPNQWFSVDLGEGRSLVVDHYCLRHGYGEPFCRSDLTCSLCIACWA